MSVKHIYPRQKPDSGVSLYGELINSAIENIAVDYEIYHYEIGYNEYELFWQMVGFLKHRTNQKVVVTLHDPPVVVGKLFTKYVAYETFFGRIIRKTLDLTIGRIIIRKTLQKVDALLVLNGAAKPILTRQLSIRADKVYISHLPTLTQTANFKQINHTATEVLYFGNISYRKGVDVLIDALATIHKHEIILNIIGGSKGNESYYALLKEKIRKLPKNITVVLHGYLPEPALAKYIYSCDIMVLPYRDEGVVHASGPLAAGLHAGKPVICSHLDIFNDVIDGQTGLLFRENDADQLAQKISELVSSPVMRKEVGNRAAAWAHKYASRDAVVKDITRMYKAL